MAWAVLIVAGLLEIVWALGLKASEGFTKLLPSSIAIVGMLLSFGLLAYAMKTLPVGTAYAVWTGIGAAGAVIAGIIVMKEPVTVARMACLALILLGVIGLRVFSKE